MGPGKYSGNNEDQRAKKNPNGWGKGKGRIEM